MAETVTPGRNPSPEIFNSPAADCHPARWSRTKRLRGQTIAGPVRQHPGASSGFLFKKRDTMRRVKCILSLLLLVGYI